MNAPRFARLGSYQVIASIGAGGMGEVFSALDPKLGRKVALKVLPDHLSRDPAALARFEREARALASLNHPGILHIYDLGREGEVTFVVTELLEGRTLREALKDGPLQPRRAAEMAPRRPGPWPRPTRRGSSTATSSRTTSSSRRGA